MDEGGLESPVSIHLAVKYHDFKNKTKKRLEGFKGGYNRNYCQGEQPTTDDGADKDNDDMTDFMKAADNVRGGPWVTIRDA